MAHINSAKNDNEQLSTTSSAFLNVISQMNIDTQDVFQEKYQQLWQEASDENALLSLLLCDIDLFDLYTENYSEQSTSFMLLVVALALKNVCQTHDALLGQYQNHKFMVLLKGGDESGAKKLAEALQQAVVASKIEHKFSDVSDVVTLSVGISNVYPTSVKQMMEKAEIALISAKATAINDAHAINVKEKSKSEFQTTMDSVSEQSSAIVDNQVKLPKEIIASTSMGKDVSRNDLTPKVEKKIEQSNSNKVENSLDHPSLPANVKKNQRFSALKAFVSKSKNKNEQVHKSSRLAPLKMGVDKNNTVNHELPLTTSAVKKKVVVSEVVIDDDVINNNLLSTQQQNPKLKSKECSDSNELDVTSQLTKQENNAVANKLKEEISTVDNNKQSNAAIIKNKPQSTIEKHIATLKTADENQETKVDENNTVAEKLTADISTVDDRKTSKAIITKNKPQSAIEKHIATLKVSEDKKETKADENKTVVEKLAADISTVNDSNRSNAVVTNNKPQSAIEKHIATLKTSEDKKETKAEENNTVAEKLTTDIGTEKSAPITKNKSQIALEKHIATLKALDDKKEAKAEENNTLAKKLTTDISTEKSAPITKNKSQIALEKHIATLKTSEENKETKAEENNTVAEKLTTDISTVNDSNRSNAAITKNKPQSAIEKHIAALANAKLKTKSKLAVKLPESSKNENVIGSVLANKPSESVSVPSPKADTPIMVALKGRNRQQPAVADKRKVISSVPLEKVNETVNPAAVTIENNKSELALEPIPSAEASIKEEQKDDKLTDLNESGVKPSLQTSPSNKVSEAKLAVPVQDKTEVSDAKNTDHNLKTSSITKEIGAIKINKEKKPNNNWQQHLLTLKIGEQLEFDNKLTSIWKDCCEEKDFLSMFISEIDFFTSYVQHYGKAESEKALIAIASTINKACDRQNVFIFYLGNGTFAGLMKGGNATKTLRLSEKICSRVSVLSIQHQLSKVSDVLTMSLGLSHLFPSEVNSIKELKNESNSALHMAILLGRDQVSL